jgi:capsular exopolysaccharide synthesis family protein
MKTGHNNRIAQYDDAQGAAAAAASAVVPTSPNAYGPESVGMLHVIWRRRWTVLLVTVACVAASVVYVLRATPVFTSTSRLYVEQGGPRILSDREGYVKQSDSYLYNQMELIKSTPILSAALETTGMRQMKTFHGMDNPLAFLKSALQVNVGKKDDIISVALDSPHPQEAAQIVNEVVDSYVTYQNKQKRSTAAEVLKILQKEKIKRDDELEAKLKAVVNFKKEHGALSFEHDKGNVIVQRFAKLSDVLTSAQVEAIDAQASFQAGQAVLEDPMKVKHLIEARLGRGGLYTSSYEDAQVQTTLNQLKTKLVAAKQELQDDHPAVQSLTAQVAEIERGIAEKNRRFAEAYVAAAKQQWEAAKFREVELQREFERQEEEALKLNSRAAEFAKLESDWKRAEKLCDIIDERIKELNVVEDAPLNISILEVAQAERDPTKPQKARIAALGLILGLMLGVAVAFVRELLDQRLRSVEEIRAILDVPVLGVVPHMPSSNPANLNRGMTVHLEPMSEIAEAYRTVRTAVYFGVPDGEAKRILVTSPAPGDGKSTSASNLACAMAQAGQRVVLVDCDFRRPTQHKIFGLDDKVGLSSVLAGRAKLADASRTTAVEGLDVIPCGPLPPNPAEILNSQAFAELLDTLAKQYDHVVIDSPPVMPVTDARILGALCDLTVLVLRAEKSTRKFTEHAREALLSVGARILGVIVNDVPRSKGSYGYGNRYGYYSQDYKSHREETIAGNGNGNDEKSLATVD